MSHHLYLSSSVSFDLQSNYLSPFLFNSTYVHPSPILCNLKSTDTKLLPPILFSPPQSRVFCLAKLYDPHQCWCNENKVPNTYCKGRASCYRNHPTSNIHSWHFSLTCQLLSYHLTHTNMEDERLTCIFIFVYLFIQHYIQTQVPYWRCGAPTPTQQ